MRRFTTPLIIGISALFLVACNNGGAIKNVEKPKDAETSTAETEDQTKVPVPENLKHEGYKYYGLDSDKELTYSVKLNEDEQTGVERKSYLGLVDGKPRYEITRAEGLAQLGTEVIEIREDGVYTVSARDEVLTSALLGLPSTVEAGKAWDITNTMKDINGQEVKLVANNIIGKPEKVTVPAGPFDCIVISMKGKLTNSEGTQDVAGKTYFAAGVGVVKLDVNYTTKDGKKNVFLIELKQIGSAEKAE